MTSTVYDPSSNVVRIGGHSLIGVTSIKVKRGNDTFKMIEGVHPTYSARVKMFKRPFTLSVKLLQTSDSNRVLQYLNTSSEVLLNSFFRIELIGQDNKGKPVAHLSSTGCVLSAPDLDLEMDSIEREWVFMVNAFDYSGLTDLIN